METLTAGVAKRDTSTESGTQAIKSHVDTDDLTKREVIDSLGRTQRANHVNESGLYALILGSTKDAAKRFKRWVTSEVLPAIRKTGSYQARPAVDPMRVLNDPAAMRGLLLTYTEKVIALESTVAEQAPKVAALNRLSASEGSLCISDAAKALGPRSCKKNLRCALAAAPLR